VVDAPAPPDAIASDPIPADGPILVDGGLQPLGGPCDPRFDRQQCQSGNCLSIGGAGYQRLCTVIDCSPTGAGGGPDSCAPARCVENIHDLNSTLCAQTCDFDGGGGSYPSGLACASDGVCLSSCSVDRDCPGNERCDVANEVCINRGNPQGRVGDSCNTDADCPEASSCLPPQRVAGGYCLVFGCLRGGIYACDARDVCVAIQGAGGQPTSVCLRGCQLNGQPGECGAYRTSDTGNGRGACYPTN
jgi:hypothetical protein